MIFYRFIDYLSIMYRLNDLETVIFELSKRGLKAFSTRRDLIGCQMSK